MSNIEIFKAIENHYKQIIKGLEEKKTQEPDPAAKPSQNKRYHPLVLFPQTNDPLASLKTEELPPGVTLEQARDPGNPDLISCLGVLNLLAGELEKARTVLAADGRRSDNKVVSDNWGKAIRKAKVRLIFIRIC